MQNPELVTTQAFDGYTSEVADELGVSDKRVFQMLDQNNPYPKIWRLLNPLGRVAPHRLELVRADFNARCDRLTRGRTEPSTAASLNKELDEAVQHVLEKRPVAERRVAITEAIAELQKQLDLCDNGSENNVLRIA